MPSITLPVPPQVLHGALPSRPLPLQSGQTFSPVPGVPGAASSPGLTRAWPAWPPPALPDELLSLLMTSSGYALAVNAVARDGVAALAQPARGSLSPELSAIGALIGFE